MRGYNFQYHDGNHVPDGLELLISILVRYPEVCSVRYLQEKHALKFQFLLSDSGALSNLPQNLLNALDVFHQLEEKTMRICHVEECSEENYFLLTVTRDVDTMNQNEVGLIVEVIKQSSNQDLLYDETELPEEEILLQEELIEQILGHLQKNQLDKNFVAVREEGRVLVYRN